MDSKTVLVGQIRRTNCRWRRLLVANLLSLVTTLQPNCSLPLARLKSRDLLAATACPGSFSCGCCCVVPLLAVFFFKLFAVKLALLFFRSSGAFCQASRGLVLPNYLYWSLVSEQRISHRYDAYRWDSFRGSVKQR